MHKVANTARHEFPFKQFTCCYIVLFDDYIKLESNLDKKKILEIVDDRIVFML